MTDRPAEKPKHTPSSRRTLDEVLHSLQDLLRNELHDSTARLAPPASGTPLPEEKLAVAPTPTDMIAQLEGSLAALEPAGRDAANGTATRNGPPASDHCEDRPDRNFQSEVTQHELPFADPATPASDTGAGPRTAARMDTFRPATPGPVDPVVYRTDSTDIANESVAGNQHALAGAGTTTRSVHSGWHDASRDPRLAPATVEVSWDDIPVLENAVELAPTNGSDTAQLQLPATTGSAPREPRPPPAAALPQAHAHRIAVLAVARLDLERRKSGEPPLDSTLVARLAQILEEMLVQDPANMENDSSK
ncbi:MAG: hypothetical protein ACYDHM_07375 [Acidiferrobacterales bacterium]